MSYWAATLGLFYELRLELHGAKPIDFAIYVVVFVYKPNAADFCAGLER